jgi:hypothetical protein
MLEKLFLLVFFSENRKKKLKELDKKNSIQRGIMNAVSTLQACVAHCGQ